jgi:hypothetical protein
MNCQKILRLSKSLRHRQSLKIRRNIQTNAIINSEFVEISDEVKHSNKPMVALESTIITHGLPFPNNMETALQVEEEVRKFGALPATIAFINGKIRVGLKKHEIEMIAKRQNEAVKISRRDLPYVFSRDDCKIGGQLFAFFEFYSVIFTYWGFLKEPQFRPLASVRQLLRYQYFAREALVEFIATSTSHSTCRLICKSWLVCQ